MKLFATVAAATLALGSAQVASDFACGDEVETLCGTASDVKRCLEEHRCVQLVEVGWSHPSRYSY